MDVPLTPRHGAGLIGIWESEDAGQLGLEWYYTGQQRLEANPYRQASRPYMLFGALIEERFGHARPFVNGENLGNVKQTNWDPCCFQPPASMTAGRLVRGHRLTAAISMAQCACSSEPAEVASRTCLSPAMTIHELAREARFARTVR